MNKSTVKIIIILIVCFLLLRLTREWGILWNVLIFFSSIICINYIALNELKKSSKLQKFFICIFILFSILILIFIVFNFKIFNLILNWIFSSIQIVRISFFYAQTHLHQQLHRRRTCGFCADGICIGVGVGVCFNARETAKTICQDIHHQRIRCIDDNRDC